MRGHFSLVGVQAVFSVCWWKKKKNPGLVSSLPRKVVNIQIHWTWSKAIEVKPELKLYYKPFTPVHTQYLVDHAHHNITLKPNPCVLQPRCMNLNIAFCYQPRNHKSPRVNPHIFSFSSFLSSILSASLRFPKNFPFLSSLGCFFPSKNYPKKKKQNTRERKERYKAVKLWSFDLVM